MSLVNDIKKLNQRIGEPQGFTLIRSLASQNFEKMNWPSKKLETWRYSPTQKLQDNFTPQFLETNIITQDSTLTIDNNILNENIKNKLNEITRPHFLTYLIYKGNIFEYSINQKNNIQINSTTKKTENLSAPYEFKSLKKSLEQGSIDSSSLNSSNDKLESLNLSYFDQGFLLDIKENSIVKKPIHIIQIHTSKDENPLFQTRLHILASMGSQSTVIETHIVDHSNELISIDQNQQINSGTNDKFNPNGNLNQIIHEKPASPQNNIPFKPWTNSTTIINVENNATLTFVQWFESSEEQQITHRTRIHSKDKTRFHLLQGVLSEGWTRNETTLFLEGCDSEHFLHNFGYTKSSGISDHPFKIEFHGNNNQCQQIIKNLLINQSRAIFNGHILIQPTAQKTNSSQLHQSLLLSTEAEVDSKPELEIYADDVKATHGATVGQLNPDELFYFQSRGISKEKAHSIICLGFISELCDHLSDLDLRSFLKNRISSHWFKEQK